VIIQTIALSSALAGCPVQPTRPMLHALTAPVVPVQSWPVPKDWPEKTDPAHGEGSGESPMYVGLFGYGTTTASNVSAHVMVDSGASGTHPYTSVAWLPKSFNLVSSPVGLELVARVPSSLPFAANNLNVSPNATKHMSNPSTIQTRRSFTRPRR
jgi:hypothetical protein